jgi:site-specific recombinase XerD
MIMRTIKVYLREHNSEKRTGVIWVSFYVNRQKVNFSTGVCCQTKHWNKPKEQISSGDIMSSDKNLILENIRARINNVFVKYRLRDKKLTRDAFIRAYNRPDDYPTFWDFIKDHGRNLNYHNELSTVNVHNSVIAKAKEFAPELHFDDITTDRLDRYYSFLRTKKKNTENTAYKNLSTFRKYVRHAYKKGYLDENPFDHWKIRRTKANYTYLTESELNILLDLYKNGCLEHRYHKTLEFFLFMCFSSLHIGDALLLKLEQVNETSFTYYRIKNRNKKPEPILVPVSSILDKVIKNIVGLRKQGFIFENLPANQTKNRYIKSICKIAGINKEISHKSARHTFATYYLQKTKDITSLKEILGHSELRETLIYAHVLDETKQEGIKSFDAFYL